MNSGIELIDRSKIFRNNIAIVDEDGEYTYGDLAAKSCSVASALLDGDYDLKEKRVVFLVPPGFEYISVKFGIWRAGGISVPLCTSYPKRELEYVIDDCKPEILVSHPRFEKKSKDISSSKNLRFVSTDEFILDDCVDLPSIKGSRRAMIIYTSGTTGKPKGVVSTHKNIKAQILSMIKAWDWRESDYVLNVLPLHHLHGILNLLLCPLWAGAKCETLNGFNTEVVWNKFKNRNLTLFMGVPTIYSKLIQYWSNLTKGERKELSNSCKKMRLMVSGSAALPVKTMEKWEEITGHILLERYGMTEIGMALSNPLHGKRMPGCVGRPMPGVQIELFNEANNKVLDNEEGEIRVRGENVFLEYWNRPFETEKSFYRGWFKTGDLATRNEDGVYKILGRNSVDIIKSGGYKISALEVENIVLENPKVMECAVVGIEDDVWGEKVGAALVLKKNCKISIDELRIWCRDKLATYKLPTKLLVLDDLPRNAMGKITKTELVKFF